jgi:hypothetical protein
MEQEFEAQQKYEKEKLKEQKLVAKLKGTKALDHSEDIKDKRVVKQEESQLGRLTKEEIDTAE